MDTYGNTGNEGQGGYGDGNGYVSTYGNRGNEGQRGNGDENGDVNTYGNRGNEVQRGYGGGNGDVNTSGNRGNESQRGYGGGNGDVNTSGNRGNESQRGYGGVNGDVNTSGNRGNEPSRHRTNEPTYGGSGAPTPGGRINEPSRHNEGDIDIFVHPGNRPPLSMQANLNWTLDKLHTSSANRCSMSPGQCHSSCAGKPVSGSSKVREAGIKNGSTVILNMRLRGG